MSRNFTALFLLSIAFSLQLYAQSNLRFTHYTTQEGLSNNIVTTLFQDSRGLLWIGTSNGLNYFDGVSFQSIYPTDFDKVHLHSDIITQIGEDNNRNILLITGDGLLEYSWASKTFRIIFSKTLNDGIADFIIDKANNIWVLSNKYLQEYNPQWNLINTIRIDTLETEADKATFDIKFYCIDNDGNIWFHDHGTVCKWNVTSNTLQNKFNNYQYKKNFNLNFSDILQDKKNYWLLAREPKTKKSVLGYFNSELGSLKLYSLKTDYLLTSLRFSDAGKIWITSIEHGLFIFDTAKKNFEVIRHNDGNLNSPVDNLYSDIYKDKDGNFWLASLHGLDKCTDVPNNFLVLNNFGYDNPTIRYTKSEVNSITPYKNYLLISTTGGYFKTNTESLKQQYFKYSKKNYTLKDNYWLSCFLNNNVVLTSTWKGLFTYNLNQKQLYPLPFSISHPAIMDSVPVVSTFRDCKGNLWLGMLAGNGIYRWDKKNNSFIKYDMRQRGKNNFPLRHFTCATEDDYGNIWMSYDKGGVTIFDTALQRFIHAPAIFSQFNLNGIDVILNDQHKNLWLSTSNGLFSYSFKTQKLKQYTHTNGLASNIIGGLAFDKRGILWMGTDNGLSGFDTATKQFNNFSIADGLPDNDIDQLIYDSTINKICFTTRYTVVLFNPDILSKQIPALSPVITAFYVTGNQRSLNDSNKINLSYKENFFSFNYTAANFVNTTDTKYQYKLEGFNKTWVDAGKRQYAGYTNLNGGNYVFRLRATNDNGIHWYETSSPVSIHISTSFYKTGWFYVLISITIVIIIGLFFYTAYQAKLKRIISALKIRNEIASDLHDDVGSSLSSIMLMSELAKKTHENTENYFNAIKENAGEIIENMNDIVWAVNPNNDNMEQLLIRMQSFASSLLEKKNIAFEFIAADGLASIKLSMQERKNFYLIFKEVIHNIFKYAECNSVITQIKQQDKNILITIKDNGKGFDATIKYTGNGLKNISRRAIEMQGKLEVISALNKGTAITLAFKPTHKGS